MSTTLFAYDKRPFSQHVHELQHPNQLAFLLKKTLQKEKNKTDIKWSKENTEKNLFVKLF